MNTDLCSSVVSLLVAALLRCGIRGQLFPCLCVPVANDARQISSQLLNSQFALNLLQRDPLRFRQKVGNHDQLQGHHQGKEREGVAA